MVAAGMPAPGQVRASGGGTASPLWRQILADVLEAEIATVSTTEGAAYGAALLAAVGAGWFATVEAAADGARHEHGRGRARARTSRATRELHAIYRGALPGARPGVPPAGLRPVPGSAGAAVAQPRQLDLRPGPSR